jgi:hypothetical protein
MFFGGPARVRAREHVLPSDLMTTKITLILVALLLVPGCTTKKPTAKAKDAGAESVDPTAAAAEARRAGDGTDPAAAGKAGGGDDGEAAAGPVDAGGRGPNGRLGGYIADDGGVAKQPLFDKMPDVPKTLVVTIGMGAEDYDVMINPETTRWRIPMKAKAAELLSLAQRARAAPDAKDGQVTVFLGNSVDPAVGQAMMEALRNAGFKQVKMSVPRPP